MSEDFATLGMDVDSSGLVRGRKELGRLTDAGGRAERGIGGSANKIGAAWKGLARVIGPAAVGIAAVFGTRSIIRDAENYELRLRRIQAILKATGGVAGRSSAQLEAQAQSLARASLASVDGIMAAQQTLLTFRNIRGQVFDETIQAALDLSTAMGQDLNSSILQVAKALEDPVRGMTALSRSGTVFTDQQREMVKAMVDAGDTMGAQNFILSELNDQYGGAAEAVPRLSSAYDSLGQSGENARRALNDLLGITDRIADVVEIADSAVQFLTNNIESFAGVAIAASVAIGVQLAPAIWGAMTATYAWVSALVTLKGAIIATGIGALVVGAGLLIGEFIKLVRATGSVGGALSAVQDIAVEVFGRIPDLITGMTMKMQASTLDMRADFLGAIADMLEKLGPFSNALILAFVGPYKAVVAAWNALPDAFKRIGALAINGLIDVVSKGVNALISPINSILEAVQLPPIPEPDMSGWKAAVPEAQGVGAAISDALSDAAATTYVGADGALTDRFRSMQSDAQGAAKIMRDVGQVFVDSATRPLESLKQLEEVIDGTDGGSGGAPAGGGGGEGGGGGGGVAAGGGAGGAAGGGLIEKLKTLNSLIGRVQDQDPRAAIDAWHGEAMAALNDANLIERGMMEEHNAYKLQIEQMYQDQLSALRRKEQDQTLGHYQSFFGEMAGALQSGGENMLKISKAFGVAEAIVSMWRGAAKALELPFPANLSAWAKVLATGMKAVQGIKSARPGSSGGAASSGGGAGGGAGGQSQAPDPPTQTVIIDAPGMDLSSFVGMINKATKEGYNINLRQA